MFSPELIFIWALTAFTLYVGIFWMLIAFEQRHNLNKYPKAKRYPTISVVVPAYNEERTIKKCIKSIQNLYYPSDVEIIVVNDGSTDSTQEIAREFEKKGHIKLINQKNTGKGAALNSGLAKAKGEIIAVMDADSIVDRDALKKLVGHFEEENVAAVVSSIKGINTNNFIEKLQSAEYVLSSLYRRLGSLTNMIYITPGVFSLFRKDVLKKVGGFDAKNLTEDLEIALRLRFHGYEIRNSMTAVNKTILPTNLKSFYKQRMRWYRGLVKNTFRYKKMLFNPKYGYLGTFQLPMNIIFPFISLAVAALFVYVSYIGLSQLITELSIVGFRFNPELSLEKMFLQFDWLVYIPWLSVFLFGVLLILFSYGKMRENLPKTTGRINSIIFLLVYFTIINFFWAIALIKELKKSEEKW